MNAMRMANLLMWTGAWLQPAGAALAFYGVVHQHRAWHGDYLWTDVWTWEVPVGATIIVAGLILYGVGRLLKPAPPPSCPACRYNLTGTPGRCPECGWRESEDDHASTRAAA